MFSKQFGVLLVDQGGQVAAVVQDHVQRFAVGEEQRLLDAPIVFLVGFALPGEDRDAGLGDRGGGVILRRELIAAAPGDIRAQFDQRLDQDGRLDGHVQAAGDAGTLERLGCTVFRTQRHQAGHFVFGQHDLSPSPIGQRHVFDFVRDLGLNFGHVCLLESEENGQWFGEDCRLCVRS